MSKTISNEYPGGSTTNTNNITVNVIPPSGGFCPLTGASGSDVFCTRIAPGDVDDRFSILYDGILKFGDGTNPVDTVIERTGVNELTIDNGTLNLETLATSSGSNSTAVFTSVNDTEGANSKFTITTGGEVAWSGSSAGAQDTFMYRDAANSLTLSASTLGAANATLRLGTVFTEVIDSPTGSISIGDSDLTDIGHSTFEDTILSSQGVNTDIAFQAQANGDPNARYQINCSGLTEWGSGLLARDTYLRRNTTSELVLSSTSAGAGNATLKVGRLFANTDISTDSGNLNLNPAGNIVASGKSISCATLAATTVNATTVNSDGMTSTDTIDIVADTAFTPLIDGRVSGDVEPRFTVDGDAQVGFGPGPTARDTWLYRDSASSLILSASSRGTAGGQLAVGTLAVNNNLITNSGDLNINPAGSNINCSNNNLTGANSLSLTTSSTAKLRSGGAGIVIVSNSSETADSGNVKAGTFSSESGAVNIVAANSEVKFSNDKLTDINIIDVANGGTANTTSGCTQTVVFGQGNAIDTAVRAFVQGANNTYDRGSSSAIIGSSGCFLIADSSVQSNNCIIGCSGAAIGTATGTTGTQNVVLASSAGTGSIIVGNSASRSLIKAHKYSVNVSDSVAFSDDGNGFGGTTTLPSGRMFHCSFQSGYFFNSNAARTVGVQVVAGANTWTNISDIRLKNIEREIPLDQAYDAVDKVRVVNYTWKDDVENKRNFGVIAQEVNDAFDFIFPRHISPAHQYTIDHPEEPPIETVSGDEIAYISLGLIKHQKQLIKDLSAKNSHLENIVIDLIKRIEVLENGVAKPKRIAKK